MPGIAIFPATCSVFHPDRVRPSAPERSGPKADCVRADRAVIIVGMTDGKGVLALVR
jgi:hypothetical protein